MGASFGLKRLYFTHFTIPAYIKKTHFGDRAGAVIQEWLLMRFKEVAYPGASPTLKHRVESTKDVKTPCY
jgi:hypothetical protein